MPELYLIERPFWPIYDQLLCEERLLRGDRRNICLISYGSSPAIVMGISGKAIEAPLPLIKRFSGGGTVVVNEDTIFITFIFNRLDIDIPAEPKAIMRWTAGIYEQVFDGFALRDNDYVFGDRKFAGNAQYIKKDRWLHHSSFLWDFEEEQMKMLPLPERRPAYRGTRDHLDFVTTLKERYSEKEQIGNALKKVLQEQFTLLPYTEKETILCRQTTEKIR